MFSVSILLNIVKAFGYSIFLSGKRESIYDVIPTYRIYCNFMPHSSQCPGIQQTFKTYGGLAE
jgi:hypothetical protein